MRFEVSLESSLGAACPLPRVGKWSSPKAGAPWPRASLHTRRLRRPPVAARHSLGYRATVVSVVSRRITVARSNYSQFHRKRMFMEHFENVRKERFTIMDNGINVRAVDGVLIKKW